MKKSTIRSNVVDALTLPDLCRFCRADETWIIELIDHGVLKPHGSTVETWHFHGINIVRAKKASRLNQDLGVNAAGAALVLTLLEERDVIRRRLAQYEGLPET